ncbi:MAG: aminoacyl-tRNA deacylase [Deltaproteobacteria bacterium]|nr:aminoacyl-tRNA deacylase [Deltaproteobacteria bacterium]
MSPIQKTNAIRFLETLSLPFELKETLVEGSMTAEDMARALNLPPEMVYKTLLLRGDKTGLLEAMVPAGTEIDLKALAALSGNKKVAMTPLKELFPLTGYVRGGCSPLAGKHKYPVFILDELILLEKVLFNAGKRGLFILMDPQDLIKATGAVLGPIGVPSQGPTSE